MTGCVASHGLVRAIFGASSLTGASRSTSPLSTARSAARAVKLFEMDPEKVVGGHFDPGRDDRFADAADPDRPVPIRQRDRGAGNPVVVEDLLDLGREILDIEGDDVGGLTQSSPVLGPRPRVAAGEPPSDQEN